MGIPRKTMYAYPSGAPFPIHGFQAVPEIPSRFDTIQNLTFWFDTYFDIKKFHDGRDG